MRRAISTNNRPPTCVRRPAVPFGWHGYRVIEWTHRPPARATNREDPQMLSNEENQLLTGVGPETPMGQTLRRYWTPTLLSWELPAPDGPPVRVRLLGEDLVAFRDSRGRVGLLAELCPHRRASLWLGRNEQDGLRCVYHGWKFDVTGQCVDQMNEPVGFASRIRTTAYPAHERGGIVWTFMGPPEHLPPLPDFEYLRVADTHRSVTKVREECNWVQALEGGIDTSHAPILHRAMSSDAVSGNPITSPFVRSSAPNLELDPTDYGYRYYGVRSLDEADLYVRGYHFVMPFTQVRPNQVGRGGPVQPIISGHHWVPLDDYTCMVWNWSYSYGVAPLSEEQMDQRRFGNGRDSVDWDHGFRSYANKDNSWMIDRPVQATRTFSGIPGTNTQDRAVQESMGPIVDRSQEHLGPADRAIIVTRQLLLEAIGAVERGDEPLGAQSVAYNRARAIDRILPRDDRWRETIVPAMCSEEREGAVAR
ncbi:MAG: Rieske 2Fe-2S domain-containing protein [Chloroflexi bacterium]|nr:Rieske 2Fe-2S domain-containing protein [Chloroflexota bacterium]